MENNTLTNPAPARKRPLIWRVFRVFLFLVACFATLWLVFVAEENWRGKRQWENYQKELKAKGEWIEVASLVPPQVPDEENFAMTPSLKPILEYVPGTYKLKNTNAVAYIEKMLGLPNVTEPARYWLTQPRDLGLWAEEYARKEGRTVRNFTPKERREAALEVLKSMQKYDPILNELHEASKRPHARFPVAYEQENAVDMLLPHLGLVKSICRVLGVRASAELAAGRTDDAFNDIELMFYVADSIQKEPILISHLVRIASSRLAVQPVWEGLITHSWSDAQLKAFEERFRGYDLLSDSLFVLRGERTLFGNSVFGMLRKNMGAGLQTLGMTSEHHPVRDSLARLILPNGWIYMEQRNYFEMFNETLLPMVDVENRRVSPSKCEASQNAMVKKFENRLDAFVHHRILSGMLLPAVSKTVQRSAEAQSMFDRLTIACVIERYRLANGKVPEDLDALIPSFAKTLPHDVVNGESLKYRVVENGNYILYSIGWNERDDGGTVAYGTGKTPSIDMKEGDWVWKSFAE